MVVFGEWEHEFRSAGWRADSNQSDDADHARTMKKTSPADDIPLNTYSIRNNRQRSLACSSWGQVHKKGGQVHLKHKQGVTQ